MKREHLHANEVLEIYKYIINKNESEKFPFRWV